MLYLKKLLCEINKDTLIAKLKCLGSKVKFSSIRKDELINEYVNFITNNAQDIWSRLDDTSKLAMSDVIYSDLEYLDSYKFTAKYNDEAIFATGEGYWGRDTTLLGCLFLTSERILTNYTQEIFKPFAVKPPAFKVPAINKLPQDIQTRSSQLSAIKELQAILQLIEFKPLKVSDKTNMPSSATITLLNKLFEGGDYYQGIKLPYDKIGDIKAIGWIFLLQAGKLIKRTGMSVSLTAKGKKALVGDLPDELKSLWSCWLNNKILDEFKRIHNIKGQASKIMKRGYTDPFERRQKIESLLKILPANAWLSIDDVAKAFLVNNLEFQVTNNQAWGLYIGDPDYGSLAGQGNTWHIIEESYLLCVLFEYAATVGMIDVAFTSPVERRYSSYSDLWCAEELDLISRYDGLTHIKITDLGSYILGNSDLFEMELPETTITISDKNIIYVNSVLIPVELKQTLNIFAENIAEQQWQLSEQSIAKALKNSAKLTELRAIFNSYDVKISPSLEELLDDFTNNTNKLKLKDKLFLYECATSSLANSIMRNKAMSYAIRADDLLIAIPEKNQAKFSAEMLKLKIVI